MVKSDSCRRMYYSVHIQIMKVQIFDSDRKKNQFNSKQIIQILQSIINNYLKTGSNLKCRYAQAFCFTPHILFYFLYIYNIFKLHFLFLDLF